MSAPALTAYASGSGQVSGDQLNTMVQNSTNVVNLRTFTGVLNMVVYLQGTTTSGDGGQGLFYWNSAGTGPDDNGTTSVVPTGATTGCWTRISNVAGTLASIANLSLLANISGGSAAPIANTLSAILDATMGSTQGSLLVRGASLWAPYTAGTAATVLTSNGAGTNPTWQAPAVGTGAMTLLSTQAISSVASVSELALAGGYTHYIWEISNLVSATNNVDAYFTVQQGGVFVGGTAYYSASVRSTGAAISATQDNGAAKFIVTGSFAGINNVGTSPSVLRIEFWQPSVASILNVIFDTMMNNGTTDVPLYVSGGGYVNANIATTGIKLVMSAGNITSATCKLYGVS